MGGGTVEDSEGMDQLTRAWHDFHTLALLDSEWHVGQPAVKQRQENEK